MDRPTLPIQTKTPAWRMRDHEHFRPGDGLRVSPWRHTGRNLPHFHDFIEIVLIVGGSAVHESPHGREPLGRGHVLVIRPGAWHAYWECKDFQLYNCLIRSETLETTLRWLHMDPLANELLWDGPLSPEARGLLRLRVADPVVERCVEQLEPLAALDAAGSTGDPLHEIGRFLIVLHELAAAYDASRARPAATPARLHPAVSQAVRLLDRDLAEKWTLEGLAATLRIDPSYLARLFTAHLGLPPMAYLSHRRLEHAASLLAGTTLPVADIAYRTGFGSPAHFAQRFKRQFGRSARAYRASLPRA